MNKINLELKHYCSNFAKVREILKEIGAKKEIVKRQKDYFFELPIQKDKNSPRLKLRIENKKQTLVYYERPDFVEKGVAAEIKLYDVKDSELLPFLKTVLGVKAIVEKKREVWRKLNTVFHIDMVKTIGGVFEIELQKKGKISALDRKQFQAYQEKLLPYLGKIIRGSNVDLVSSK